MALERFYQKYSNQLKAIACWILLISFTMIYFNGTRFHYGENELSNVTYKGQGKDQSFNRFFFGANGLGDFIQKYYALEKEYETNRNWGLIDSWSERTYYSRYSELSRDALGSMQVYQEKFWSEAVKNRVKNESLAKTMKTPAMIFLAAAAIYTGRTLEQRIDDDILLKSRTSMNNSKFMGEMVALDTGLANGSFEYKARDANQSDEDYKAGITKNINLISATAGASYATQSQTRTLSLSKQISDHVSLSYDHAQSQKTPTGHTLGLGFSAGF